MNNYSGVNIEPSLHYHMGLREMGAQHHSNGVVQDCSPSSVNYSNSLSPSSGEDDSSNHDFLEANIPQYNDVLDFDLNNSIFSLLGLDRIDKVDENEVNILDPYSIAKRQYGYDINDAHMGMSEVKSDNRPSYIDYEPLMLDALDQTSDALGPGASGNNFSPRDLAFLNDLDLANLPDLMEEFGPDDISHLYSLVHGSGSPLASLLPQSQMNEVSSQAPICATSKGLAKCNPHAQTKGVHTSPTTINLPPTLSFGSLKRSQPLQSPAPGSDAVNRSTQFREKIIKLQQKIGAVFKNELDLATTTCSAEQGYNTHSYPHHRDGVIKTNNQNVSPIRESPTCKKLRFNDTDSDLRPLTTVSNQKVSPTQFLILNKPLNTGITANAPLAHPKQPNGAQFILPHGYRQSVLMQPQASATVNANTTGKTLGLASCSPLQNGLKFPYCSPYSNESSPETSNFPDIVSYEENKQVKKLERMMKNRESASISRRRKKEYIKSLESRVEQLTREKRDMEILNGKLKRKIDNLETENTLLKKVLPLLKLTKPGLLFCFVILFIIRLSPPIYFNKTNESFGKRMDGIRQLTSLGASESVGYNNRLLKGLKRHYNASSQNGGLLQPLSSTPSPLSVTTESLYYYDKVGLLENNLTEPNTTLDLILHGNENIIAREFDTFRNISFQDHHVTTNWVHKAYQALGGWLGLEYGPWSEFEYHLKALALFMSHYDVPSLCASANFVPLNSSNATNSPLRLRLNPKLTQWVGSLLAERLFKKDALYSNLNRPTNYTRSYNDSFAAGLNLPSELLDYGNLTKRFYMEETRAQPYENRYTNRNFNKMARKSAMRTNKILDLKSAHSRHLKSLVVGNKTKNSSLNATMDTFAFNDAFSADKQLNDLNTIWSKPAQYHNDTHPAKISKVQRRNTTKDLPGQPDCLTVEAKTVLVNRTQMSK